MKSFPWDSIATGLAEDGFPIYDRAYGAQDLREVYETFFTNGIFINSDQALVVKAAGGLNITVGTGKNCIKGTIGYPDYDNGSNGIETVTLETGNISPRIDTIVLRWENALSVRNINVRVVKGQPTPNPVRPSLTRTRFVYELGLADIYVPANATSISQANIIDTRLESSRCGVVTPLVKIDTTSLFYKFEAAVEEAINNHRLRVDNKIKDLETATNNAIYIADKLTGSIDGEGCGCYAELKQVKDLLNKLLSELDNAKYYVIGTTLYPPKGRVLIDGEKVTFNRATVSGEHVTLS